MNEYALHFGTHPENIQHIKWHTEGRLKDFVSSEEALDRNLPQELKVFCDGDSFRVWGEKPDPSDIHDYLHVVVSYPAVSDTRAWYIGTVLWKELITSSGWDTPPALVQANCWPSDMAHVPFSITTMEDWSIQITAKGERK